MKLISRRFLACTTAIIIIFSTLVVNCFAFDSIPSMTKAFIHDGTSVSLVADAVLNSQTGLYTLTTSQPLYNNNPTRDFYCLGTMFIPGSGESYDSTSKFQYTISLVTSAGNSFKITDPTAYGLFHTSIDSSGSPIVSDSTYITYEPVITNDSGVYTFSFNDLTYESIANARLIYMQTSYDNVTTYTINDSGLPKAEVTLLNVFFGLTSDFDQDAYNKEVINKLDNIESDIEKGNQKLDDLIDQGSAQHEETKGLLGRIIDGITGIPGKIKDAISNLIEEIKESVVGNIKSTMDSFLETLKDKLGILYQAPDYFIRIIQSIMTTEKSNEMIFPSMVIPVGEDEYTLNEPTPFQIFPDWIPEPVYVFINLATSIIVIFAVINFAEKKWEEISTNG